MHSIVVGYTESFGSGFSDIWVLCLDKNGNIKWQKTYGNKNIGESANAVAVAPNGDFLVAGSAHLFMLDPDGNIKWQKSWSNSNIYGISIAQDGDIIVVGHFGNLGTGLSDAWVLRLDKNGNIKWEKTYGGSGDDWARAVAIAENGDIIVAGGEGGNVWVLRLDKNGNLKWQKAYGDVWLTGTANAVTLALNGDIIVAGQISGLCAGKTDVWVLRLPENGELPRL